MRLHLPHNPSNSEDLFMRKGFIFCFFIILCAMFLTNPVILFADDAKIQALKDAIKANPNEPTAHFNLGLNYFNQSQYDSAIPEFESCVRLNPNDSPSHELLEMSLGLSACVEKNDCS